MTLPLGMCAALLERWDDARAHFDDALASAAALESPPLRARVDGRQLCRCRGRGVRSWAVVRSSGPAVRSGGQRVRRRGHRAP
jgi:hypothetical protein